MKYVIVMGLLFGFSFFVKPALAVSINIESSPDTITEQPFTLNVSLSGAQPGQNYLRVDIYKDGTSNYFGETFVGSDWYSGSVGSQYVPITIPDSSSIVTANLQARIGTPNQNDFPGAGTYKVKVRRYTSSGNPGEVTLTPVDVQINYSLPTATPNPTPTSRPTPTPSPSHTPTPTKIPTSTPTPSVKVVTPTPTKASNLSGKEGEMPTNYPTSVLGASTQNTSPTPEKNDKEVIVKGSTHQSFNVVAVILCVGGGFMLCICGILLYLKKRRGEL